MPHQDDRRFVREILAGGGSTAAVSALLNPIDVVKTRRQLYHYRSFTAIELARRLASECNSGSTLTALWRPGLTATIARELVYSGATKGIYPVVRDALSQCSSGEEPALSQRVLAASLTGFLGSIGANAFDVIKIRQFDAPERYGGSLFQAIRGIAQSEGAVMGLLMRGCSASAPRGAAIAVGEVTTYDHVKSMLRQHYEDGFGLHVIVSLITGVVATTVAAPFDLLKSRVMASDNKADGAASVLMRLLRHEGPFALFNGWWPTYCRLGPHAILTFPLFEASRRALGLDYL